MRKLFIGLSIFLLISLMFSTSNAQSFYFDPATHPVCMYQTKDTSYAETDSNFMQFTLPTTMYYRGFTEISASGGVAVFRFVRISSPNNAIDSCNVTESDLGVNLPFVSAKAGSKIMLSPGVPYRIEYIYGSGDEFIRPSILIWFTFI